MRLKRNSSRKSSKRPLKRLSRHAIGQAHGAVSFLQTSSLESELQKLSEVQQILKLRRRSVKRDEKSSRRQEMEKEKKEKEKELIVEWRCSFSFTPMLSKASSASQLAGAERAERQGHAQRGAAGLGAAGRAAPRGARG